MIITNRQCQIIGYLLDQDSETAAKEIAEEIQVSTRTVHRELLVVEAFLSTYGIKLHKKSGTGILIQADEPQINRLKRELNDSIRIEYSANERQTVILCFLLQADEPTKLFSLAHDLEAALPVVSRDLEELEPWIHNYELSLVRRRGYGVEISGTEAAKRMAIANLAIQQIDESEFFGKSVGTVSNRAKEQLLRMIGHEYLLEIENGLWLLEIKSLNEIPEKEYTEMLIHLSVALNRIKAGKKIEWGRKRPHFNHSMNVEEMDSITAMLSNMIGETLHDDEKFYIMQQLEKARSMDKPLLPQESLKLFDLVRSLTQRVEAGTGESLQKDYSLREGLLEHMQKAVQRITTGTPIRNPLLQQIKKDNTVLYHMLQEAAEQLMPEWHVPEEEIGYLVMHFGAAMEKPKQAHNRINAIVVCTNGIGSSKLMAARLEKEFPQIVISANASWFEAARIPEDNYDIIISTIDLPLKQEQFIKISPLLTLEDKERLSLYISEYTRRPSHNAHNESTTSTTHLLNSLKLTLDEILRLTNEFEIFEMNNTTGKLKDTLLDMCEHVKKQGILTDAEPIVSLLIQREKQDSQIIPNTRLALFHTRSEIILRPCLSLCRLSKGMQLGPERQDEIQTILLMLGPWELPKESLEVLSEISSFLLDSKFIHLLEEAPREEIKLFLSKGLLSFLQNKLEMEE